MSFHFGLFVPPKFHRLFTTSKDLADAVISRIDIHINSLPPTQVSSQ